MNSFCGFCGDCKFWSQAPVAFQSVEPWNSTGVCVRHPPVPVVSLGGAMFSIEWRQPETKSSDRCGEWESKHEPMPEKNRNSG